MANLSSAAHRARHHAERATDNWLDTVARIGYATKGVLYVIIGVLAVQAAVGAGGATTGSEGAIRSMADEPFGQVLLALTAVGLLFYALWRLFAAAVDAEHKGTDAKGLFTRAGFMVSGLIHLFLAFQAASIVFGWQLLGGGGGGGGDSQAEWTADLMAMPFGRWLVGIAGGVIILVALGHFYEAYKASFMREYNTREMDADTRRWARRIGQFGLSARGVVFALIGAFLIQAALQAQPEEARGISGALDSLAAQPYGPWLLGLVAAGLVAYGVFCFSRARYRHFDTNTR